MRVDAVELVQVDLPLVRPFRTSFGTETVREALLVRVRSGDAVGWGECVAGSEPLYSSEYLAAAWLTIREVLVPRLFAARDVAAAAVASVLAPVKGHRMAKAALEMAVLDAELRFAGKSLASHLGAVVTRVAPGVSVGIPGSLSELLDIVDGHVAEGYGRVKLKIEPGWDVDIVTAVRQHIGEGVKLQVDANTAYERGDFGLLKGLDACGLLLIEQPFGEEDLLTHRDFAALATTPVCLDESIVSESLAAQALDLSACSIINIKPGRVGGYLEAVRIHDLCVRREVPVWCGGMLETGIGRAANLALAALPGFVLPGDISATDRYYKADVTAPFVLEEGTIAVPDGPGLGVEVDEGAIDALASRREEVR